MSDWLIARLKKKEELRLRVYIDTTGNITIGWGHNLGKLILPKGVKLKDIRLVPVNGITLQMAEQLLHDDVLNVEREIARKLPWFDSIESVRYDVLIELVFNIGFDVLDYPVFIGQIRDRDYAGAAKNMRGWDWYEQVHAARAEPLCRMMESGVRHFE